MKSDTLSPSALIFNPSQSYEPQRWQQFLIYIGYNLVAFLINAFLNSSLNNVNKAALTWSITGFVLISITVLACASPNYSSADFVFRQFVNQTGWPDGIAWLLGVSCSFMLSSILLNPFGSFFKGGLG